MCVLASIRTADAVSFMTGAQLNEVCASEEAPKQSFCNGFVAGMVEAHDLYLRWYGMRAAWCVPGGVTTSDLRAVVTRHLEAHPTEFDLEAGALVADALTATYPCSPAP